jgi:hypothetical protein
MGTVAAVRTGRDVVADLMADATAWRLSPMQEIAYLHRVKSYHYDLLERAEQAERSPADHVKSAEHFGRWVAVSSYLIWLLKAVLKGHGLKRASIHGEERP